jgi:hypothetical protein
VDAALLVLVVDYIEAESCQVPFWFTVALNCAALAWACTPAGAQLIRSLAY